MHRSDFEPPPFKWSLLSVLGGLVTSGVLIVGFETAAKRSHNPTLSTQSGTTEITASPGLRP